MDVILLVDVKKVGQRGSVVTVASGYALNVLIPQKKALPATAENLKRHMNAVAVARNRVDQNVERARVILSEIDGKSLHIAEKASPTGTLFKSLHSIHVLAEIKKQWGTDLPGGALKLEHPIKQKGTYTVPLDVLGIKARILVIV